MRLQNYLSHLIPHAELSDVNYKHAAGVIKGGKLLNKECNTKRTYCGGSLYPSCHAEHQAIHSYLKGPKRYVIRP